MMDRQQEENLGGMVWYAECMDRAFREVASFVPPASEVRFFHSLFVVNLMSLVERSVELFGDHVMQEWIAALDGPGGLTGVNNASYVRELRNAVVHRGVDIAASGVVIENHVRAVAPPEISDRFGRRGPFNAFGATLFEIFCICRLAVGPVILRAAEPALQAIEQAPLDELRANYLKDVSSTAHMPEWAKQMARGSVDQIPFDEFRTMQSNKLRSLLA